jgi:arabinan endo-1,5-alpha-L-arabinosidase
MSQGAARARRKPTSRVFSFTRRTHSGFPRRSCFDAALGCLFLCLMLCLQQGCKHRLQTSPPMQRSSSYQPLPALDPLQGDIQPVHDPSLICRPAGADPSKRARGYLEISSDVSFRRSGAFLSQRCSPDLLHWQSCGFALKELPEWLRRELPHDQELWAPDLSYFGGKYHLYYAASALGSQHSAIGQATRATLPQTGEKNAGEELPGWLDAGPILVSHPGDRFNAIDPNIYTEPAGADGERAGSGRAEQVWLQYGSFWGGIYQQGVDPQTGRLAAGGRQYHLALQPADRKGAMEGAALGEHNGWYYLFASVGLCCELPIERDTYQEIVGRSRSVHGPYVDQRGLSLLRGGGTVLISGDAQWVGPGGGSLWQSGDRTETFIAFHALNRAQHGAFDLFVERVDWVNDWPVLRPVVASTVQPKAR